MPTTAFPQNVPVYTSLPAKKRAGTVIDLILRVSWQIRPPRAHYQQPREMLICAPLFSIWKKVIWSGIYSKYFLRQYSFMNVLRTISIILQPFSRANNLQIRNGIQIRNRLPTFVGYMYDEFKMLWHHDDYESCALFSEQGSIYAITL